MAKSSESSNHQPETKISVSRTPLFDVCVEFNARMTDFAGWEMPVQFSGIAKEHTAVRTAAGMFDISHMGKFVLQGQQLINELQGLVPSDLSRLQPGEAQYTVLLNAEGGILDDIIVYFQGINSSGKQSAVIIVNAATAEQDKTWLLQHLSSTTVEFEDWSRDKVLIAIQGPTAINYLQPFVDVDLSPVPPFGHLEAVVFGDRAFLARTGYTGEDGFEVMVDPAVGVKLWRSLLDAGVVPCGLGARDTLRLEAAMALYGNDIDQTTTPLEAGLNWLIHLDTKGDFIGRSILAEQKQNGVPRRLVGLQMQGRHIARHGYPVLFKGEKVGIVTSGTLSPSLGEPIALAYVPSAIAKLGQFLDIEIRGKTYPAVVVKKPFYRGSAKKKAS